MPAVARSADLVRRHLGRRFVFYAMVSGVATVITQVALAVLHGLVGWRASVSNIVAVGIATPVSYYMNRAWVWQKRGRSNLTKEVAPFWAFSFAGLLLSTLLVGLVAMWQDLPMGQRPTAFQQLQINAANALGFGILWMVQFFVLDKISFKTDRVGAGDRAEAGASGSTPVSEAAGGATSPAVTAVRAEAETW